MLRLTPQSYNGFLFQQQNKVASDFQTPYDLTIGGINTNEIPRSQNFPLRSAKTYTGAIKVININLLDLDLTRDDLVIAMSVLGEDQQQLISVDKLGRLWYVNADFIGLTEDTLNENTASFGAVFAVDDPLWKKLVPSTETISVNVTGNGTITPLGNQPALPVITITPLAAGSNFVGFTYQRFIQIINNSLNPLNTYPLNLTGAGLDTAALIADNANKCQVNVGGGINASVTTIPYDTVTGVIPSAGMLYCGTEQIKYTGKTGTTSGNFTGCTRGVNGTTAASHADNAVIFSSKMAADGNDLRIYVDGVEVKRWFGGGGINSSTTKIWINWTQPANTNMTLGTAIAGAGPVSTIQIENTAANIALMATIPIAGNVLIGSEIFVYTGVNVGLLQLTGVTRAAKQTSAAAHAAAAVIYFVTHDVWMRYGDANIAPYVVDDTQKPIIKLTSTNTSHIYEEFYAAVVRPGSWVPAIDTPSGSANSRNYTATQNTLANPATVIGSWIEGTGVMGWKLYNPIGITHVTRGDTKRYSVVLTSFGVTLESSVNGITYDNSVYTLSAPATPSSWETVGAGSSLALGRTDPFIYHKSTGTFGNNQGVEYSDFTLTLDSAKAPTINLASEASTPITLYSVLTNAATGESMTITLSMNLNTTLTIDTKEKTITLYDGTNEINALIDMPIRPEWFQLLPKQANDITITDAGQVTFAFSWEDRSL